MPGCAAPWGGLVWMFECPPAGWKGRAEAGASEVRVANASKVAMIKILVMCRLSGWALLTPTAIGGTISKRCSLGNRPAPDYWI